MASASNTFTFPPTPQHYYTELFNWCCGEFDKENIIVVLSHDFDRKPADEQFEKRLDELWELRLKEMPSLYNGSKFRLKDLSVSKDGLKINIGISCYRDFICTNMNMDSKKRIRDWGRDKYGDPHACFADPIGVNGVVVSRDDHVVFIRRSNQVYEAAGKLHTPGGHPEPNEVLGKRSDYKTIQLGVMDPKNVVHELFYSIVKEVRDEVNLPEGSLSWPVLIGILRNEKSSGRPELCFLIRCSLRSQEIKKYYDQGGPEAYESTEIILVRITEFKTSEPSDEMRMILNELTPSAKACLHFLINQKDCQHGNIKSTR